MSIYENFNKLRSQIPKDVKLVVAAKGRTTEEIREVITAGAVDIGENYVQEAEDMINNLPEISKNVKWHLIGHLQSNKINKALKLFQFIQTIDSIAKVETISQKAKNLNIPKVNTLIEINIASESAKKGASANLDTILKIAQTISRTDNIVMNGLMTMGPNTDTIQLKEYFKLCKQIFDNLKKIDLPNVNMQYLSMGMSDSYQIAIDEGANMVRIGTSIFGPRI